MERFRTLNPDEIEVKVKQVGEKGTVVLLYKTARTDYELLDATLGAMNWQCDYQEIKGNLYCTISIWDEAKKQWIRKQNCGIESRADGDGNEKKGEASDALKRAGFVVGIGRELYSSPFTFIPASKCPTVKDDKGRWQLKNKFTRFDVSEIGYDENRRVNRLVIVDDTGNVVFTYGSKQETPPQAPPKPVKPPKNTPKVEESHTLPEWDLNTVFEAFVTKHGLSQAQFTAWRDKACADPENRLEKHPFKTMTQGQWTELFAKLDALADMGYFNE